jgi:hypothetical protein
MHGAKVKFINKSLTVSSASVPLGQIVHGETFISLLNRLYGTLVSWNWSDGRGPQTLVPSLI